MVKITIIIDSNEITVNQSTAPTKVAKSELHYFAVMSDYDESSRLEYITQSARDAFETKELLEAMNKDCNRSYRVVMQNNGCIIPCKGADWDID